MSHTSAELVDSLAVLLNERRLSLAIAESCTGGLIAAALTDCPGSSSYFERGFITYSNDAKVELLGVPKNILDAFGAVSAEVAQAMAAGALHNSRAQSAISVTGIAGPDGGTAAKPVGLVYIGAAWPGGDRVQEYHFTGNRAAIRAQASNAALSLLLAALASSPVL